MKAFTITVAFAGLLLGLAPSAQAGPQWFNFSTQVNATLWNGEAKPVTASQGDSSAVELGVRFRSDIDGFITAIRFYKGPTNPGPHVGHLWTNAGTLLASVTFAGETASGWQQATLAAPVSITANTDYVVSYYAPAGGYSVDLQYFSKSLDTPPLHASGSPNGVYSYGGGFPVNTYQSANYWVDVVFSTSFAQSCSMVMYCTSP